MAHSERDGRGRSDDEDAGDTGGRRAPDPGGEGVGDGASPGATPGSGSSSGRPSSAGRDRDVEGRARSARPRDGLGRPLPYGEPGVERQPEGVVRTPEESLGEAQRLLDAGMPFHAHEVFEDAWKSGPAAERALWRGLAQLAVGLTHAARGNTKGAERLLLRGAGVVEAAALEGPAHGLDRGAIVAWARDLAARVGAGGEAVDPVAEAPHLRG